MTLSVVANTQDGFKERESVRIWDDGSVTANKVTVEVGLDESFVQGEGSWVVMRRELVRMWWKHVTFRFVRTCNQNKCLTFRFPPIMKVKILPSVRGWDPQMESILCSSLVSRE